MQRFTIGGDIAQIDFDLLVKIFSELGYFNMKVTLDEFIVFSNLSGAEFALTNTLGAYLYRCYIDTERVEEVFSLVKMMEGVFKHNNATYIIEVENSQEMILRLSNWSDRLLD